MDVTDKRNTFAEANRARPLILELGCGDNKRNEDAIGVDVLDYPCVDIVGDVYDVLKRFRDESVTRVYSYHFFEHVDDLELLVTEIGRVLKPGGELHVVVPHFSNPYFYSDYTHKRVFGLYSFSYLAREQLLRRKVPRYSKRVKFELCDVFLIFKSSRPFYFRHAIKWLCGRIFNLTTYTKEFYEENLCYLVPCYEVAFKLKRLASD